MKAFLFVFSTLLVAAYAADSEEFCYNSVRLACKPNPSKQDTTAVNCTAGYGAIYDLQRELQAFTNAHILKSFEYLLMSTHFANYERNRKGFEKLFRGMSDEKWEDAFDLIKHITKRGGVMNFGVRKERKEDLHEPNYELYEFESIAKALDMEKQLATETHHLHAEATRRRENFHDPEISSFLEEEFVHKQADTIRKLSGYATDLSTLLKGPDSSLSLYIFDDYLQS